jgi:hypothetical protein
MPAGDTNLFFNRDTKVYAVQYTGSATANVWELPVLNGYSFSQSTNASQVTLNEMASITGNSRRGQASFNDSLAPAEWSFDMYARPTTVSSVVRAPEEILWNSMLSETTMYPGAGLAAGLVFGTGAAFSGGLVTITFTTAAPAGGTYFKVGDTITVSGVTYTNSNPLVGTGANDFVVTAVTNNTVVYAAPPGTTAVSATNGFVASATFITDANRLDFTNKSSNKTRLGTFDLYFVLGAAKSTGAADTYATSEFTTIYKIANCCVNEATLNFDIDGITTISFSGMGTQITEQPSWTFATGSIQNPDQTAVTAHTLFKHGTTISSNMIRNRSTALNIIGTNTGINSGNPKTYGITLTGGSITISNNMTFLTPEAIGVVNVPLGHVTGTRSISGNFTCYADELTNGSIDLYQDLIGATTLITNKFQLQFFIGGRGTSAGNPAAPGVMMDLGQCHLEIPTINIDDVIGFEVNFTALPTTISGTDELTRIRYVALPA